MTHALFVENDAGNLATFELICEEAGIQFSGIQDSTKVKDQLDQLQAVDIVVVDLDMPKLDGYAILAILRNHQNFQRLPIVACTVHNNEIDHTQVVGFDSFLLKPVNIDLFAKQLTEIVSGGRIWQTHAS